MYLLFCYFFRRKNIIDEDDAKIKESKVNSLKYDFFHKSFVLLIIEIISMAIRIVS